MEMATLTLQIETVSHREQAPRDFPRFQRTLEYVFDEPIQPGPKLTHKVTFVQGSTYSGDILPDIEIARLMLSPGKKRFETAPYAWQRNGQVQPEYRTVLEQYMDEIGATDEQKKSASPHGYGLRQWTPEDREAAAQQRAAKLATSYWNISLCVPPDYKPLLRCRECGQQVRKGQQQEHKRTVPHEKKTLKFDMVRSNPTHLLLTSIVHLSAQHSFLYAKLLGPFPPR